MALRLCGALDPDAPIAAGELVLEPIVAAHAERLFEALQHRALYTFIPEDPPGTLAALRARYERWARRHSDDRAEAWLNYAIARCRDGALLGTVQATIASDAAWIAYQVLPAHWRTGVARSACAALIEQLFVAARIRSARARVDTRNTASWRLLEALGFTRLRTIPEADFVKGAPSDEFEYALDHDEWRARRAGA